MKQFGTIFKFEFLYYLKNKVFVGVTVFFILLTAAVMFFPRIGDYIGSMINNENESPSDVTEDPDAESDKPLMLLVPYQGYNAEALEESMAAAFPSYDVRTSQDSIDSIKEMIASENAECAFVFDSETSYIYYVNNLSMYDFNPETADEVLQSLYRLSSMIESGLTAEQASAILSETVTHTTESLGKNQMNYFFYTYIMIFALYMVILLYGQMVATNVASEKSSRAMELLITSAKPANMMFGKVIASCIAGLCQLIAIFGSAFLFFNLNKEYWDGNNIVMSIFDIPLNLLVYMLIFFILGFFIYAFLYGAIGSTASKVEDINTSVMPLTMLFIVAFMVVVFSMSSGSVDNIAMKVCSFIPFTSPMAMFTRIAMSTVPIYEIIISIAILIASVFGVGILSAKIYRVGVLLYGTTPKIGAIIKAVIKA